MTNINNYFESEESHGSNYTSNKRYFLRIKPQFTIQKVGAAKISGALLKSLKRSVLAILKTFTSFKLFMWFYWKFVMYSLIQCTLCFFKGLGFKACAVLWMREHNKLKIVEWQLPGHRNLGPQWNEVFECFLNCLL